MLGEVVFESVVKGSVGRSRLDNLAGRWVIYFAPVGTAVTHDQADTQEMIAKNRRTKLRASRSVRSKVLDKGLDFEPRWFWSRPNYSVLCDNIAAFFG